MRLVVSVRAVMLSMLTASAIAPSPLAAQDRGEESGDYAKREANFIHARADASGAIPASYWSQAWASWTALPASANLFSGGDVWRSLGPNGLFRSQSYSDNGSVEAGRVTSISVHPTNGQIMYVGSASGGVWRTTTGGALWTPLTDDQCSPAIGSVVIDPKDPTIIYAGTGEINVLQSAGCGVLKSTTGGSSWTSQILSSSNPSYTGKVLIDSATAGTVGNTVMLAADWSGIYVSTNSGGTWQQKIYGKAYSIVAVPGRPGAYLASVYSYGTRTPNTAVWQTTNSGATWSQLVTPLSTSAAARIELATSAAAPNVVFALAGDLNTKQFAGLFRVDSAASSQPRWTTLSARGLLDNPSSDSDGFGQQANYDLVVAVDPRSASRLWVAGVGAFASTDGGLSFANTARSVHADWHAIVFDPSDPDHMIAGTDGGVYVSYDGGRSWSAQNNGLAIAQFTSGISVSPNGMQIFGGLQDNNVARFSGSSIWDNITNLGDGGYTLVNYLNTSIVYVVHPFRNIIGVVSAGVARSAALPLLQSENDRANQPRPLALDPIDPRIQYFGTYRVLKTVNEWQSSMAVSGDLTGGSGYITTIAVAPSDRNVIYVGTSDGRVTVSRNAGATWGGAVTLNGNRFITRIAVDPANPGHVLASSATAGATKLTESKDFGANFNALIQASSPFGQAAAHAVMFVPVSNIIMVGVEYGVLQSSDGGTTWTKVGSGLPAAPVYDLVYVPATNSVIASTYGRGMFSYSLGAVPVLRGDVDVDTKVTAADAALVQQALVGIDIKPFSAYPAGDANCDGKLDGSDVLTILRASVGLTTTGSCANTTQIRAGG